MTPISQRELAFKEQVFAEKSFPKKMLEEFFEYWSEPNRAAQPKMRFELEKTWHLHRRLARWQRNSKEEIKANDGLLLTVKEYTEFDKLNDLLLKYQSHPTSIPFDVFGKWYDFMKKDGLLADFKKEEKLRIFNLYGKDLEKCKCWAVQATFDTYTNTGMTIKDIKELRAKLA